MGVDAPDGDAAEEMRRGEVRIFQNQGVESMTQGTYETQRLIVRHLYNSPPLGDMGSNAVYGDSPINSPERAPFRDGLTARGEDASKLTILSLRMLDGGSSW